MLVGFVEIQKILVTSQLSISTKYQIMIPSDNGLKPKTDNM